MKSALLSLVLLTLCAGPLTAREVPVSDLTFGTPPGFRRLPAIAEGTDGFLAAWIDSRHGTYEVIATRLSAAGVPLDRHGITLGESFHGFSRPQIIWNGEAWLVFWSSKNHSLVMSRVETDGISSEPRQISDWAPPEGGRWAVTNGSVIVVAHGGSSWGNADIAKVYVTVLTMDGDVISSRIIDTRPSSHLTAIAHADGFTIGWHVTPLGGPSEQMASRLDSSGVVIDATPHSLGTAEAELELLRNGNGYLLAGADYTEAGWQYFSQAFDRELVGSTRFALPMNANDRVAYGAEDDGRALLVIREMADTTSNFTAIRFDDQGRESGRKRFVTSSDALTEGTLVRTANGFASVWLTTHVLANAQSVDGATFDANLERVTPQRALTETAPVEGVSSVVAGASEVLIATRDAQGVRLRQFTFGGDRLPGELVLTDVYDGVPDLVFDGTKYVIAYNVSRSYLENEVVVRFLQPRGGLLADEVRLPVTYPANDVTLVRGASSTLVTWRDYDTGVRAATLDGTRLATTPRVVTTEVASSLTAAWNGEHFLLAWHRGQLHWDFYLFSSIAGRRFEEDLTPADAEPRLLLEREATLSAVSRLVASGSEWLLAFEHRSNVDVVRIDANANVIGGAYVTNASEPRLAADGNNVTLAWTTRDTGALRAAPLAAGASLASEGITIVAPVAGFTNFGYTADVAQHGSQLILVYARRAAEAGSVPRVFAIFDGEGNVPLKRRATR